MLAPTSLGDGEGMGWDRGRTLLGSKE